VTDPSPKQQPKLKERLEALCVEMIDRGILFSEALDQFEKCFILEIIRRHDGNMIRAAQKLKIHRNTLAKRVSSYRKKSSVRG
jgi:DNA-binding NtrC family response regulator